MGKTDKICIILVIKMCLLSYARAACPADCTCRGRNTQCSDRDLHSIPQGIPSRTQHLKLQSNRLVFFSGKEIAHLTQLKSLDMSNNELEDIGSDAFKEFSTLRILELGSNNIQIIHRGTFSYLTKLRQLGLSNNLLQNIDGVLVNLKKLTRLDISGNMLHSLSSNTFMDLSRLQTLDIAQNNITGLSSHTFQNLTKMSNLDMSGNPLVQADDLFSNNNRLSYIEFTRCSLQNFPKILPLAVRILQMGLNNISSITVQDISPYKYIQILVMDQNQIRSIEDGAFSQIDVLKELWLNLNFLLKIPAGLPKNLRQLHIDRNEITAIDGDSFAPDSVLESLSIQGNLINSLAPDNFKNLPSLKRLHLGGNHFTTLSDGVFSNLGLLNYLSLTRLDLGFIHNNTFSGLSNMEDLDMSFILLTDGRAIQGDFFSPLGTLQTLNLQESPGIAKTLVKSNSMMASIGDVHNLNLMDNSITTLSSTFMNQLPPGSLIQLARNHFHCDQRLIWIKQWIEMEKHRFTNPDEIECYTPVSLRGISLLDLPVHNFVPTTIPPFHTTADIRIGTSFQIDSKTTATFNSSAEKGETTPNSIFDTTASKIHNTTQSSHYNNATEFSDYNRTIVNYTTTDIHEFITTSANATSNTSLEFLQIVDTTDMQDRTVVIAIGVSLTLTIVAMAIIIAMVIIYKRRAANIISHQVFKNRNENEVTFFVSNNGDETVLPRPNLTREDRSSVTSKPGEDITNEYQGDMMKVYTWDAEH